MRKKVTKTIEVEEIYCDVCGKETDPRAIRKCDICKKDFCEKCGDVFVGLLRDGTKSLNICLNCFDKYKEKESDK